MDRGSPRFRVVNSCKYNAGTWLDRLDTQDVNLSSCTPRKCAPVRLVARRTASHEAAWRRCSERASTGQCAAESVRLFLGTKMRTCMRRIARLELSCRWLHE